MFDENSAVQDRPQGADEIMPNPVTSVLQMDSATAPNETPSVSGSEGLPWYLADKYEKRNNKSGNGWHLAPLDTYKQDVIDEATYQTNMTVRDFMEDDDKSSDKSKADSVVKSLRSIIKTEIGRDTSGRSALPYLRQIRDRLALSLKICGATSVDQMHRVQNAQRTGADVEAVKANEYFQRAGENRDYYAMEAVYSQYIWTQLQDEWVQLEQQPVDFNAIIGRMLYDDAIQAGNRLKAPRQAEVPSEPLDRDALRIACA